MTPSSHPLITVMAPAQEVAIVWEGVSYTLTALNVDDDGALRFMCAAYHKPDSDDRAWLGIERHDGPLRASLLHYGKEDRPILELDLCAVLDAAAVALRAARVDCSDDDNAILAQALGAVALAKASAAPPAPRPARGFERPAHAAQIYHLTPETARAVRGADPTPKEPQMRLKNCSAKLSDLNVANAWKVQRDPTSRRPKKYVSFTLKVVAHLYTRDQVKQLIPGLADMMPNLLDQATDASPEDLIKMSLKRMFDTALWIFKGEDEDGLEVRVELQADIKGAPTITLGGTCEVAFKLTGKCERSRWMEMHELLAAENITVTTAALQQDLLAGLSLHPGGLTYTIGDAS